MKWRLIPPNKSSPKYRLQRSANGGAKWQKASYQAVEALNVPSIPLIFFQKEIESAC
jgi:hypothetical protein